MNANKNYLLNMDSLNGMKNMQANSVDLVLTDPPYGIADSAKLTKVGNKIVSTNEAWGCDFKDAWDNVEDYWNWFKPFVEEMVRVMKDGASMILFLDRKYTGYITYMIEKEFDLTFKNKVYFRKRNPVPSLRKVNYRSAIEECIWFSKGKANTFNFGEQAEMTQVYEGPIGKKKTKHPTEKYSWMLEPLIKNHSNPGDVILDCFAGSGSTVRNAIKMGRHGIGFEMSPVFHAMAKEQAANEELEVVCNEDEVEMIENFYKFVEAN
jgi:DNA modification methylase